MTVKEYNKSVDLYSDNVFRFILKSINDVERAKDIVQDCYEKLWLKIESVSFQKVKSYLFSTAYHTMIDSIRKEKNHTKYLEYNQSQGIYEGQEWISDDEKISRREEMIDEMTNWYQKHLTNLSKETIFKLWESGRIDWPRG